MGFELILFLVFISLFMIIFFRLSKTSGWSKLGVRYRNKNEFNGVIIKNISANLKSKNYLNGILNIGVNDKYIHLSINPFFRFFMPNLLVPVHEITFSKENRNLLFKCKIEFKEFPDIFICITNRNARKLGIEV